MEKYAWIPVDPTFKNSNPQRDFFGKIVVHDPVVILSYGTNLSINAIDGKRIVMKTVDLAQNFSFWFYCAKSQSVVSPLHRFEGKLVKTKNKNFQ
jgi:hypothetical protein